MYKMEEHLDGHQRRGRIAGCQPLSLSKLSVIRNQQFAEYILKRPETTSPDVRHVRNIKVFETPTR